MAQMTLYEASDVFKGLFDVEIGPYADEVLTEGSNILANKMKENARVSVMHDGESDMVNSIKASTPKLSKNGAYIVNVGPRGYSNHSYYAKDGKGVKTTRKYKVSNALKAIWKEYGIPGRQEAQPFISKTVSQTESQIHTLMQKRFEERLK